jgi:hypothetical protein
MNSFPIFYIIDPPTARPIYFIKNMYKYIQDGNLYPLRGRLLKLIATCRILLGAELGWRFLGGD